MLARCRSVIPASLVAVGAVWSAWLGFRVQTAGDYQVSFAPAMNMLLAGHVHAFYSLLPRDGAGGSLLLRAPAALLAKLLVGSQLSLFRFGALACILASGAIGLFLAREMRARGHSAAARAGVIAVCTLAPGVLDAVFYGHPEEPLGAALCIVAVLLAGAGRSRTAGLALGLAVANKPWALIAMPAVMLAAPVGRRRVAATFAAVFGSWLLSAYLFSPTAFADLLRSPPLVVHPPDLWWPLAHLRDPPGVIPAYFLPHALSAHARQLAAAATVPLALPLARRQNRTVADCLALLALGFLTRCLLDPSNHIYYQVPFILAVTAWEARTRGVPLIALTATVYYWLVFHTIAGAFGADVQFACYLGVTVPLAVVLGRPVLGIGGLPGRLRPAIVPGT